jgi:protein pelota
MKIIHKDLKHGNVKIKIEDREDPWYIEGIVSPGDKISGMTERKIKLGGTDERSKVSVRIVHLKISVEKIDSSTGTLRLSGPIVEAPEDIPKGDYHTFALEEGTTITIEKETWERYALKKLEDATKSDKRKILIVIFDREEAIFALLKGQGYEILLQIKGDVSKKDMDEKKTNFYREILNQIIDYDSKNNFNNIIVGSPAFWKEYLMKEVDDDILKKKITLATCSSVDTSAITEILKRPELKTVLEKDRSASETSLIDELLDAIRKDNAGYGLDAVKQKIDSGNISILLISENFIKKSRANNTYKDTDMLMSHVESLNTEIYIIASENPMKKLDGLGGIACLLRWKENYG